MELPAEVIYEISLCNPFHSFMPFLSKGSKKYWETRVLYIDRPGWVKTYPYKTDLVVCKELNSDIFSEIIEKYREKIRGARFLKIIKLDLRNEEFKKFVSVLEKIEYIDFSGQNINNICYTAFSNVNMSNYRYVIYGTDQNILESRYPELVELYYHCYDKLGAFFSYITWLALTDYGVIFCLHSKKSMKKDILEKLQKVSYLELRNMGSDIDLRMTIEALYQPGKFRRLSIYTESPKIHKRHMKSLKKLKNRGFKIPFRYNDMEKYIDIIIDPK